MTDVQVRESIGRLHVLIAQLPGAPHSDGGLREQALLREAGAVLTRTTPFLTNREFRAALIRMIVALDHHFDGPRTIPMQRETSNRDIHSVHGGSRHPS